MRTKDGPLVEAVAAADGSVYQSTLCQAKAVDYIGETIWFVGSTNGGLIERRKAQAASAARAQTWSCLMETLGGDEAAAAMVEAATEEIAHGRLAASTAGARVARRILSDAARRAPLEGE